MERSVFLSMERKSRNRMGNLTLVQGMDISIVHRKEPLHFLFAFFHILEKNCVTVFKSCLLINSMLD